MRIDSLKVQNFRCFEQAEFQFSPQFNLLVGVNGSGKTSLLSAIAASLAPMLRYSSNIPEWPDEGVNNVRLALTEVNGRVRYDSCYPVVLTMAAEMRSFKDVWRIAVDGSGDRILSGSGIKDFIYEMANGLMRGLPGALPILAFYWANRQWGLENVSPAEAVKKQDARLDGYASWNDAVSDMRSLEAWVVAKSLERLEKLSFPAGNQSVQERDELEIVNQAVAAALPGAKGVRFDIKYRRIVLDWDGKPSMPFDVLSDGQRSLTALVVDIARRMCLLNPQLGNEVLMLTPGVIAIDELDIHLHPAWQRRVVSVLKQTFPKVQFFAASHSPQIIGELPANEIILLRDGQPVGHPEYALGLDSAEVLEELMGSPARNKEVSEQLHAIRQAIDDDEIAKARELLDTLEAKVGGIPEVLENRSAIQSLQWLEGEDE